MRRLVLALPFLWMTLAPAPAQASELSISIGEITAGNSSELRITGRTENATSAPVFRLRTENGCARDARLRATTTGGTFSLSLGVDDLTDAFACAIDGETSDASLPTITVA